MSSRARGDDAFRHWYRIVLQQVELDVAWRPLPPCEVTYLFPDIYMIAGLNFLAAAVLRGLCDRNAVRPNSLQSVNPCSTSQG